MVFVNEESGSSDIKDKYTKREDLLKQIETEGLFDIKCDSKQKWCLLTKNLDLVTLKRSIQRGKIF